MEALPTNHNISVPVGSIVRLAVEAWRMRRDISASTPETLKAADARLRRIERVLVELEVRTWDPQGLPLDGGLAVVVVDRVEAEGATPTVRETLQPIVFIGDRLAAWGEVVAGVPAPAQVDKDQGEAIT